MSDHAGQLLIGDERLETRREKVAIRETLGDTELLFEKGDGDSSWEQSFHQLSLVAKFHGHDSLSNLRQAHAFGSKSVFPSLFGSLRGDDFDKAVHGLASGAFHDDVDWVPVDMRLDEIGRGDELADELMSFGYADVVWDLTHE